MFLKSKPLDSSRLLKKHFTPYQIQWIQAETPFHNRRERVMALAEKSVRIGWTYADAFKNVRKRILYPNRDYLFATKDYQSALEYIQQCYRFAEIFDLTHTIVRHGEEPLQVNSLDEHGRPSAVTHEVKIGVIKFDNGSRIIAFSANPQAMAVYGGDVGLDEFAKHPNARLLWETAQGRITWGYDLAVWSSHDGEDTLFNEFAHEARAASSSCAPSPHPSVAAPVSNGGGLAAPKCNEGGPPWNLYFRVTMEDAINEGLVELINRTRGASFTRQQFLADCRSRARDEGIFQQAYMCNPLGSTANHIAEWSVIDRCRYDYDIERVHLESDEIARRFGEFNPSSQKERESAIHQFFQSSFPNLLGPALSHPIGEGSRVSASSSSIQNPRLGFDVAASGQGDLAVIYIDEAQGDVLSLRALFTCRTEDWHFLKSVLFYFMKNLKGIKGAGDETGLGKQICWEAASQFGSRFTKVNFSAKKHDLGFALMNQLATSQKRIPRSHQDIASDYFALRKEHSGTRWIFSEGRNNLNPASHCDIAWAAALSTHAHSQPGCEPYAMVVYPNGYFDGKEFHPDSDQTARSAEESMLWSDDPRIWRRWV